MKAANHQISYWTRVNRRACKKVVERYSTFRVVLHTPARFIYLSSGVEPARRLCRRLEPGFMASNLSPWEAADFPFTGKRLPRVSIDFASVG